MDNTEVVLNIDIKNALNQIESLANTVQKLTNALTSIIDKMDEVKNASDRVGSSMKKQKEKIQPLEGSYDSLSKKMRELKKEYHAVATQAERDSLAPQIKAINDQLKDMDKAVGVTSRNVGNYTEGVSGGIKNVFGELTKLGNFKGLSSLGNNISSLSGLFSKLGVGASAAFGIIAAGVIAAAKAAEAFISRLNEAVQSSDDILDEWEVNVKSKFDWVSVYWDKVWQDAARVYLHVMEDLSDTTSSIAENITFTTKALINAAKGYIKPFFNWIKTEVKVVAWVVDKALEGFNVMFIYAAKGVQSLAELIAKIPGMENIVPDDLLHAFDKLKAGYEEMTRQQELSKSIHEKEVELEDVQLKNTKELATLEAKIAETREKANEEGIRGTKEGIKLLEQQRELEGQAYQLKRQEKELRLEIVKLQSAQKDNTFEENMALAQAQADLYRADAEHSRAINGINRQLRLQNRLMNSNNDSARKQVEQIFKAQEAVITLTRSIELAYKNSLSESASELEKLVLESQTNLEKALKSTDDRFKVTYKSWAEGIFALIADSEALADKIESLGAKEANALQKDIKVVSETFKAETDPGLLTTLLARLNKLTSKYTEDEMNLITGLISNSMAITKSEIESLPEDIKPVLKEIAKQRDELLKVNSKERETALIADTEKELEKNLEDWTYYKNAREKLLREIYQQNDYLLINQEVLKRNKNTIQDMNKLLGKNMLSANNFSAVLRQFAEEAANSGDYNQILVEMSKAAEELNIKENPYFILYESYLKYFGESKFDNVFEFYTKEAHRNSETLKADIAEIDKDIQRHENILEGINWASSGIINSMDFPNIWDIVFPKKHPTRKENLAAIQIELDDSLADIQEHYSSSIEASRKRIEELTSLLAQVTSGSQEELDVLLKIKEQKKSIEADMSSATEEAERAMTEATRKGIEERQKYREQDIQNAIAFTNSIGGLVGSLADFYQADLELQVERGKISDEEAEKEFERIKGYQIAEAIISTLAGAIGAYMSDVQSYKPAWVGMAIGAVDAAATLTAGYAQIRKIESTSFGSKSSSLGGGFSSGIAVNPLLNENRDLQNLISLNIDETANSDSRVYILQSDIEQSNSQVQIRQSESTF